MARDAINQEARRNALMGSKLFQVLQPVELDALLPHTTIRRYAAGAIVMRKGDQSTGAALILHGRVRIGSTAGDGRDVMLTVLGPGEVLGEIALLDGEEHSADVTTMEECILLSVDRESFLRLLHNNNDLCLRMMAFLCQRLRRTNVALEELALLDLPHRLGRLLIRLGRDYGKADSRGIRIELKLSQKDLSVLIGGSREKVNRQLREWEQAGLIAKDEGYLLLLRPDRLVPDF